MADLPEADLQADNRTEIHRLELSESTRRKLELEWKGIRERQKLTEEDLVRYDRELQNYERVAAKWPRYDPRRRDPRYTTLVTYRLGEAQSEAAAKARFGIEVDEYWLYWCSSGADSETYAALLDSLKQDIVAEFESLWKGRSAATDGWFEKTCRPAIEKVLSPLIERRTGQARKVEISRLDRKARAEAWARMAENAFPKASQAGATEPSRNRAEARALPVPEGAERKKLRDDYKAACKRAGVKVTDEMIAEAANPTTPNNKGWHSRSNIQKWLACDPKYEGKPDQRIRNVFLRKPHLSKPYV
jgi:hypothetical protein